MAYFKLLPCCLSTYSSQLHSSQCQDQQTQQTGHPRRLSKPLSKVLFSAQSHVERPEKEQKLTRSLHLQTTQQPSVRSGAAVCHSRQIPKEEQDGTHDLQNKQHHRWVHTCEFQRFVYLFPKLPLLTQSPEVLWIRPYRPHSAIHRSPPPAPRRELPELIWINHSASTRSTCWALLAPSLARTRALRARSSRTKGSRTMEPAQSRVPTPSPTRGWHAWAGMPIIPPWQWLSPGHRRIRPPGDPRRHGRSSRSGRGEPRDEQNPTTTNPRMLLFGILSFFSPAHGGSGRGAGPITHPSAALTICRALSRHYRDRRSYADPSPQPSPLLAALTSLRRRGAAPRPPLSSPGPPPAAPWPRPPQVRRSRREGAARARRGGSAAGTRPPLGLSDGRRGPCALLLPPAPPRRREGRAWGGGRGREGGKKRWRGW